MNYQEGLLIAGRSFPGARVCFSRPNGAMMDVAQRHSVYQAALQRCGHQLRGTRTIELRWRTGPYNYEEIVGETWPHQEHLTPVELGRQIFSDWRKSPHDWRIASRTSKYFGCGIAKSEAGVWYATIIIAN